MGDKAVGSERGKEIEGLSGEKGTHSEVSGVRGLRIKQVCDGSVKRAVTGGGGGGAVVLTTCPVLGFSCRLLALGAAAASEKLNMLLRVPASAS